MTSLAEWNEQYGDMDFFPERSGGYDWQMNVAYPCRITKAKVAKSKRGDVQIEMNIDIQGSEGEDAPVVGTERQWVDLPKQESDAGKAREHVEKMTIRRFRNLVRLYSAAMPGDYAPYHRMEERGGKKVYFDFDDKEMQGSDFNERKQETQMRIVKVAEDLHNQEDQEIDLLAGTLLYIEKVPNPNNDKYPYVNYYPTRPRDKVIFEGGDKSNVPF